MVLVVSQNLNDLKYNADNFPVTKPNIDIMAWTGESEKLIGMEGRKALVTLVTSLASKLQRIPANKGKEITMCPKNEVTDEAGSGLKIL